MGRQSGGILFIHLVDLLCAKLFSRYRAYSDDGAIVAQPGRIIETHIEQMKTRQQGTCYIWHMGKRGLCPWAIGAQEKGAKSHWEAEGVWN